MNNEKKIHILVKELIPLYDELEEETQKIIQEHMQYCSECEEQIKGEHLIFVPEEKEILESQDIQQVIQPFKELYYFKTMIFTLLFLARIIILALIVSVSTYSSLYPGKLGGYLVLYYFPFVAISNSITYLFYRRGWLWLLLTFDILVFLFLRQIVYLLH